MAEAVKQVEATINGAVEAIAELDWYVPSLPKNGGVLMIVCWR
jgi:hypothetical protein